MSGTHFVRADNPSGIFGGGDDGGGLGDQLSSLLSPIFPPNTQSSQSSFLTLSASSTASASVTFTPLSTSQSVQPTSSADSSSSTLSSTISSAPSSAATSNTAAASPSAASTPTPSVPSDIQTASSTSSSGIVATASSAVNAATTPAAAKSFLQNKSLSVGVITVASLIGVILIIAIATFAIRRRRRDKLHIEPVDFSPDASSDQLVGGGGGGGDIEQGNVPRISRDRRGSNGVVNNEGNQPALPSAGTSGGRAATQNPEMYERTGYPALPVFVSAAPDRDRYPVMGYSGQDQGYGPQSAYAAYATNAFEQYSYTAPLPAAAAAPFQGQSNLPYDTARNPRGLRPPQQRKQVPALIPLNIGAIAASQAQSGYSPPSAASGISFSASPVRPAAAENPANPPAYTPMSVPPVKRFSRLSRPAGSPMEAALASGTSGEGQGEVKLDPTFPQLPAITHLSDEFGAYVQDVQLNEKRARRYTVRNE